MTRRRLIAGNWKMNGDRKALGELDAIAAVARLSPNIDVAICPPATLIERAAHHAADLIIGAQDCHASESGAHTGCLAPGMLREAGARLVIVGHSERREAQGENDADVRAKAEAAIAAGLMVIICVGEPLALRQAGLAETYVEGQLHASLPETATKDLIIAYEPIWSIGSGLVPASENIAAMHAMIRQTLIHLLGPEHGSLVRILYGGSVNADNAASLLEIANVDGALVGGASLTARSFVPIIEQWSGL